MATATQLFTDRDAAGATYAAALASLRTAWVALRAHDVACANAAVIKAHPTGATKVPVYTFLTPPNPSVWGGESMRHPVFVPDSQLVGWNESAQAQALTLINGLT